VTEVGLLLGLLALSYVGSILASDRTIRGFGLPSGAEYLLLGFLLGPHVLGALNRSMVAKFEPVLVVAAAWLGLVAGIGYGHVGNRRVHAGRALTGIALALVVGAGVSAAAYLALGLERSLATRDRLLLAGAAGTVCCETTRHAVRWVVERQGAKGALSDALADYARASVAVPALGLAVLFAAAPDQGLPLLSIEQRTLATLGIGLMLGLVASLLLGREFRLDESWGILLGTSLLGIGVAARLGLSALATTFSMGLTITLLSQHRVDLKAMVAPTEKPLVLPIAALGGAFVDVNAAPYVPLLVGVALGARFLVELVRGALLAAFLPKARPAGGLTGLGMISTGPFTLAAGVLLGLRFEGPLGASVVVLAAASVLMGELLGPLILRRVLTRAGNIIPGRSQTPPPPSVAPSPIVEKRP
jgi:hypothetical protein